MSNNAKTKEKNKSKGLGNLFGLHRKSKRSQNENKLNKNGDKNDKKEEESNKHSNVGYNDVVKEKVEDVNKLTNGEANFLIKPITPITLIKHKKAVILNHKFTNSSDSLHDVDKTSTKLKNGALPNNTEERLLHVPQSFQQPINTTSTVIPQPALIPMEIRQIKKSPIVLHQIDVRRSYEKHLATPICQQSHPSTSVQEQKHENLNEPPTILFSDNTSKLMHEEFYTVAADNKDFKDGKPTDRTYENNLQTASTCQLTETSGSNSSTNIEDDLLNTRKKEIENDNTTHTIDSSVKVPLNDGIKFHTDHNNNTRIIASHGQKTDDNVPLHGDTLTMKPKEKRFNLEMLDISVTLGTGTFGRVFLAEEEDKNQNGSEVVYAIKVMRIKDIIKLNQVEHVNSERKILQLTDHPFIVKCFWTYRDEKCLYMLFEYVPGGELFTYLREKVRFSASDALFYVAEIISVLEYLHERDIVYRDLKPENLLIDNEGHLKFTDFGFAKILHDTTWTLCGTPEYLSPEAIQGKGHDYTCDWWALGILTYEMLVGEAPFVDDHPFGLYEKILACHICWPSYLKNTEQMDFISKLVVVERSNRLGKGQNGSDDVKKHTWLRYINWSDVYYRRLKPPILPKVAFNSDTSNFDDFDEDWELRSYHDVTVQERNKFIEWDT